MQTLALQIYQAIVYKTIGVLSRPMPFFQFSLNKEQIHSTRYLGT